MIYLIINHMNQPYKLNFQEYNLKTSNYFKSAVEPEQTKQDQTKQIEQEKRVINNNLFPNHLLYRYDDKYGNHFRKIPEKRNDDKYGINNRQIPEKSQYNKINKSKCNGSLLHSDDSTHHLNLLKMDRNIGLTTKLSNFQCYDRKQFENKKDNDYMPINNNNIIKQSNEINYKNQLGTRYLSRICLNELYGNKANTDMSVDILQFEQVPEDCVKMFFKYFNIPYVHYSSQLISHIFIVLMNYSVEKSY
jgi:hypothetical protein